MNREYYQRIKIDRKSNSRVVTVTNTDTGGELFRVPHSLDDDDIQSIATSMATAFSRGADYGMDAKAREIREALSLDT